MKCIEPAKGGYYYKDHLALLGDKTVIKKGTKESNRKSTLTAGSSPMGHSPRAKSPLLKSSRTSSKSPSASSMNLLENNGGLDLNPNLTHVYNALKIGDAVNIDVDFELVQSLQVGHGRYSFRYVYLKF